MAKDRIKNYAQGTSEINILKDIRTDLSVTPSTYTPDTSTVTRDRLVTFAQAEEELVVLGDIEKGVKQQVVKGDIADKRITNIEKLLQGNLYDYQTDSSSAYTKSVPSGAMPYAGLEKIGGKTVVMNQLQTNGDFTTTTGVTPYNGTLSASDNVLSFTATAVDVPGLTNQIRMPTANCVVGHKYLLSYQYKPSHSQSNVVPAVLLRTSGTDANISFGYFDVTENVWNHISDIITIPSTYTSTYGALQLRIMSTAEDGYAVGDVDQFKNVMLIDLTLMFGAGNEPSTVEEFEAMFPADYYAYNAGELLSAGVTEVVSKDTNNATLQTISIPTAIRNLDGYGWSAGTAYNYVDYERKVFVKNVGKVVLDGTQTISLTNWQPLTNSVGWAYSTSTTPNAKKPSTNYEVANVLTDKLPTTRYAGANNIFSTDASAVALSTATNYGLFVRVMDTSLTTETAINNYLSANPITVYYELATPVETDISAYLTDDNLIEVEANGTLTFPNSNGTDYQIPVPSEEEYMIDLQEALS